MIVSLGPSGAVELRLLASGDLCVRHPRSEDLRRQIEPICRGRGYWDPAHRNWVVFARYADEVTQQVMLLAEGPDHS